MSKTNNYHFAENAVIKNAHIVDPANKLDGVMDVHVKDGKIVKWGKSLQVEGAHTFDAKGFHLLPGLIDVQVHFRDPGFEHKESLETGIQAAIKGGFVACVTMPNTKPTCDNAQIVKYMIERGQMNHFNIFPAGALSQGRDGKKVSEMAEMKHAGAVSVTDDGDWLYDSGIARRAYEYAATHNLVVMSHAEDPTLSLNGVMNEGTISTELGLRGKPAASEDVASARDIELAVITGCHLHLHHVSTKRSVELIRRAKAEGLKVTGEASPHHIALTDEMLRTYDTNYKMNPPLRTEEDRIALMEGLEDGTIDVIATDHAPHAPEEKDQDIEIAPNGVIGLESSFGVSMTELYHGRKWKLEDVVRKMSLNPSELIGQTHLGRLVEGGLANLTLVDVDYEWTFGLDDIVSKSLNSCFLGKKLKGKVFHTFVNGYHHIVANKK